jgi:uncharacterized protein
MWRVDRDALESLAVGAGILGTGGGGNPYVAKVWAQCELDRGADFVVIDPLEVADDGWVIGCGGIGAPTVSVEKLRRGDEEVRALRALADHMRVQVAATVPMEVGGGNSLRPLIAAAQAGLPMVDADGMGRAFPELQMLTYFIYGVPACPAAIADDKGAAAVFTAAASPQHLERLARTLAIEMGGTAGMALAPMTGVELKRTAIPRSLSVARDVGDAVRVARRRHADPIAALLSATGGQVLLVGKITDVERRTATGFARGRLSLRGTGPYGTEMQVDFQNENLVARVGVDVVATVPDLICVVGAADGEPITTELLRYGQRVAVVGVPCHPMLRTTEALAVVGPRAFGYEVDYRPLPPGEDKPPWSTLVPEPAPE